MNLIPDPINVLIMWGIFLGVLFVLNSMVFQPTLKIISERKKQSLGAQGEAQKLAEENKARLASYEAELQQARLKAAHEREAILAKAREEEHSIIEKARAENDKLLQQMRVTLKEETEGAKKELNAIVSEMANLMTTKILDK